MARVLGVVDLTLLGVGAIVGTGVFVLSGHVAARHAGPAVVVSFALAAAAAMLAGATYAQLARALPGPGSAYAYARELLGRPVAALVGWTLLAEYLLAAASVAVGWSAYLASFLDALGARLPVAWRLAPWAWQVEPDAWVATGGRVNVPAAAVIVALSALLARGIRASARVNALGVAVKVMVVGVFVVMAAPHVRLDNLRPWVPANRGRFGDLGVSGVLRGTSLLFFAYNGFDAITTAAGEARLPGRDLPRAMLAALALAAVLYMGCTLVLVGVVPYARLAVPDPISVALAEAGLTRLRPLLQLGALAGLVSVMLVNLLSQPRIALAMARDRLLPAALGRLDARRQIPSRATWAGGAVAAALAGLLPIGLLGELMCVGTLWVFAVVSLAAARRRWRQRRGDGRGGLWVPASSLAVCVLLLATARPQAQLVLAAWLAACAALYGVLGPKDGSQRPRRRLRTAASGPRTAARTGRAGRDIG